MKCKDCKYWDSTKGRSTHGKCEAFPLVLEGDGGALYIATSREHLPLYTFESFGCVKFERINGKTFQDLAAEEERGAILCRIDDLEENVAELQREVDSLGGER